MSDTTLPPRHDPRRMLPCPTSSYTRQLWGELMAAKLGDAFSLNLAVMRVKNDVEYTFERLTDEDDEMERLALTELLTALDVLQKHFRALRDKAARLVSEDPQSSEASTPQRKPPRDEPLRLSDLGIASDEYPSE